MNKSKSNHFQVGDYVYRPSHLEWGKCVIVRMGKIIIELTTEKGHKADMFVADVKLVPAEVYESELYKALHE